MMSDDYSRQKLTDVTATKPLPKDDDQQRMIAIAEDLLINTGGPEPRGLNATAINAMRKAIARRLPLPILQPFTGSISRPAPPAPVGLTARQRVARTKARKQAKASRARNRR